MRRVLCTSLFVFLLPTSVSPQTEGGTDLRLQPWGSVFFTGTNPHTQLTPIFLNVREGDQVDPAVRALAGADLEVDLGRYVTVGLAGHYDTDATNNPLARTRELGPIGARGDLDAAYIRIGADFGALTIGRRSLGWGSGRFGGMNLPGHSPAADMVQLRVNVWKHYLESSLSKLSGEDGLTRLMYVHRFVFNFWDTFTLGLSDVTLTARDDTRLFWPFLLPVLPTAIAEHPSIEVPGLPPGGQTNSQVGIELEWRPGPTLFVEAVIDDSHQLDGSDTAERWAWRLGVEGVTGLGPAGYEYRKSMIWTFTHFQDATESRQYRWPMTAPEGPDMDRHLAWIDTGLGPYSFTLTAERRRRGEVRFGDDFGGYEGRGATFPSGTVEKRWILGARVARGLGAVGQIELDGFLQSISNLNNEPGDKTVVGVRLALHFRPPAFSRRWE